MKQQIANIVAQIKSTGLTDIKLLALVTDNSYEVIFYGNHNGVMSQSNNLAEAGILNLEFVDSIYRDVAEKVRADKNFNPLKMNIITVLDDGISDEITIEYDEKDCSVYSIKKRWKASVGIN